MNISMDELTDRATAVLEELHTIQERCGTKDPAAMPAGQRQRAENLLRAVAAIDADMEAHEAQQRQRARNEEIRLRAIADPSLRESGSGTTPTPTRSRSNPWAGLSDTLHNESALGWAQRALDSIEIAPGIPTDRREALTEMVDTDPTARAATFVAVASDPAYRRAFEKVLADPIQGHLSWDGAERDAFARTQSMRAALSLTDGNGGYLVPLTLDPLAVLTNVGSTNPFRRISRLETTTTDEANLTISAGVTAEWLAEGTEAADASPTFGRVNVPAHKLAAWVYGSYEVLSDTNLGDQLPRILADAFDIAEASAFATGDGSGQPMGVVAAVSATTASRVAATTASTFGMADIYKLFDALTPRARNSGSLAFVANNTNLSRIRQMDTAGSAAFWTDLNGATPPRLLGKPIFESSAMDTALTTGKGILLAGAFEDYAIVDRLGTQLVYQPMVMGANGLPTGQAGWFAYRRTGAQVLNAGSFRILQGT